LYLITPNEDELPALCTTSATNYGRTSRRIIAKRNPVYMVTQGKQGSALYKKTETLQLNAPNANVVDCTGAGDGSVSGLFYQNILVKTI
jgi:fructose-1-phosphate kinase PfkB-like protein